MTLDLPVPGDASTRGTWGQKLNAALQALAADSGQSSPAAGLALYAWGDSYNVRLGSPILPGTFTPQLHYLDQLQRRFNLGLVGSLAVGGYTATMVAAQMLTNLPVNADGGPQAGSGIWPFNYRQPIIIDCGKNDVYYGGRRDRSLEGIRQAYRTILATTSASAIYGDNDVSVAYSGTAWQARYDTLYTHGGVCYRGSAGSIATVTLPGPGTYWLLASATDDAALGVNTCNYDVQVDGIGQAQWVLSNQMRQTRSGQKVVPAVYKVVVTEAGTHTVKLTAGTGNFCTFNGYMVRSSTPPPVLFCKQLTFRDIAMPSYTYPPGLGNTEGQLPLDMVNVMIDEVTADFPNVTVVDPRPGWDPNIHVGYDFLHPTDAGETHLADAYAAKLPEALTKGTYLIGPTQPPVASTATSGTPTSYPPPSIGSNVGTAFTDSFNRTASTSALGSTDVGTARAWTTRVGTWGIKSNAAYCSAADTTPYGLNMATVASGGSDGHVTAAVKSAGGPVYGGLVVRWVDANNFIVAGRGGLTVTIAGVQTTYTMNPAMQDGADYVLDIYMNGDTVAVGINGVVACTATMPAGAPVSGNHGLVWYGPAGAGTFDWFDYSLTNATSNGGNVGGVPGGGGTPTTLVADNFNRADGSTLTPTTGSAPTVVAGSAAIASNRLAPNGTLAYATGATDYVFTVTIAAMTAGGVLWARYTDQYNGVVIQDNGNVGQFVAGAYTFFGNIGPLVADNVVKVTVQGGALTVAKNGTPLVNATTTVASGGVALGGATGTAYDDLLVTTP